MALYFFHSATLSNLKIKINRLLKRLLTLYYWKGPRYGYNKIQNELIYHAVVGLFSALQWTYLPFLFMLLFSPLNIWWNYGMKSILDKPPLWQSSLMWFHFVLSHSVSILFSLCESWAFIWWRVCHHHLTPLSLFLITWTTMQQWFLFPQQNLILDYLH